MKKFILSCIVAILCICAAAAVAYYIGNLPTESSWPNGQIRISVPRRFFVPNGIAKVYHENGKLSYQYQVINNVKNGEVRFYLPNKTVTMHYLNERLMGVIDIKDNFPQKEDKSDKPKIIFDADGNVKISSDQNGTKFLLTGKRLCDDDHFLSILEAYSAKIDATTFENLMSCFSFDHFSYKNQVADCAVKGEYVYPNFKMVMQSTCSLLNDSDGLSKDFKNLKIESLYTPKDDLLKLKAFDEQKPQSNISLSYKGIRAIMRAAIDTFFLEQNNNNISKLISTIINGFTASDAYLTVQDKKIWNIKGDVNFINGFSSPYYISSYTDNAMSSQIKITSDGVDLKALYPVSGTPMFSLGLKVNTSFKIKYKELSQEISKLIIEQFSVEKPDYTQAVAKLSEYMWNFSDLFNSLYFNLLDLQGQPVLNALVQLKKGISSEEIEAAPTSAFALKLTTYQDGELAHQAIGTLANGFTIDGEPADEQDVLALLNNTTFNTVLEDIHNELELKYGPIVEKAKTPEDYIGVDPFFLGFYKAYKESILKYKLTQTIAQITTLATSIQAIYEEDETYEDLKASDLMQSGVITHEMLDAHNVLLSAFNGKIRILKSLLEEDDDEHNAFILIYEGLPADACFELSTFDWSKAVDGFIAVKAVPNGTADVTKAFQDRMFDKRESGTVYHPYEAKAACGKGNTSSVALKFK